MRWTDIEQSEKWKTLDPAKRRAAREAYFDEFIAPQAPAEFDQDELRAKWMQPYAEPEPAATTEDQSPGFRAPWTVAADAVKGGIATVASAASDIARLSNKKYQVPFGAEISAAAGLLGRAGWDKARDVSDALEAGVERKSDFLDSYAQSADEVAQAMNEGQSLQRQQAKREMGDAMRGGFLSAAKHAFLNPLDMAETAVESLPLMGAGKVAATGAAAATGTARAAVPTMLATEGAMSAASSAEEARSAIANASNEDLAALPDYARLSEQYGPDGARKVLEGRAQRDGAFAGIALQALTLGATRRLSAVEDALTGQAAKYGSRLVNAGAGALKESVQEGFQGGAEQLATNYGASASNPNVGLLDNVGAAAVMEAAPGGIMGGVAGFMQSPSAAKGAADAAKILDATKPVAPVNPTQDEDAGLGDMLGRRNLEAARAEFDREAAAAKAARGGLLDPAESDAIAQSAADAYGVSVDQLLGRDGGASRVVSEPQAPDTSRDPLVSPDLTAESYGRARRDIRRAETQQRAEEGQPVAAPIQQQPQATVTLEPDSLRSRRDARIARNDYAAYLQENGIDMAESDRRSADNGDRVPQPEGEPVAVGPSRIAGQGIIATAPIRRPVTLFDQSADGPVRTDAGRYVNHSPQPNADVKLVQGRIVAIPNREIQPGQELTIDYRAIDPLREQLATRQFVPEPTPRRDPGLREMAAADPDKAPEQFGLPKPMMARGKKRTPADFDEAYDDALDLLALSGGLNRQAWASQGVDPDMLTRKKGNEWNKRFGATGPTLFPAKGGMTPDQARELLQQRGFFAQDVDGSATEANDAVDLVMDSINQGRVYRTPKGSEVAQRAESLRRASDEASRDLAVVRELGLNDEDILEANEFDNRVRRELPEEARTASVRPEEAELRDRIAALELELRTSEITGISNLRAFEEDARLGFPVVAAIDMDGLRRLNNTIGHEAADAVLRELATQLKRHSNDGVRFYHRSGDEFAARFRDPKEAAQVMADLQQFLETVVVRLDAPGQSYDYRGIGISYGLGKDYANADVEANRNKAERLASGQREDSRDANGTSRRIVPADVPARNAADDYGRQPEAGDVPNAPEVRRGQAFSQPDVGRKVAPAASRAAERKAPSPSGVPKDAPSRKSLATNKLSNAISAFLGKPVQFERVDLPDAVSGALDALSRITGRPVVVFRVTQGRFNANGLVLPGDSAIYVNADAASPVLTVASHEFLHKLRDDNPKLYEFIRKEVESRADFAKWREEIDSRELTSGKNKLSDDAVLEELAADALGDALTDPQFLASLAKRNPTKFRDFVMKALDYFSGLLRKIGRMKSLGSSDYLTDISGLRDAYAQMLDDYDAGVMPSGDPVPQFSQPSFNESAYRPSVVSWAKDKFGGDVAPNGRPAWQNFVEWFGDSKVVDDQGRPLVVYHGTTADVDAFDLGYFGSDGVAYSAPAIFATTDKNLAGDYALNKLDRVISDAMRAMQKFKNENNGVYDDRYESLYKAVGESFKRVIAEQRPELGGGANVIPAYMALQNPLVVDAGGKYFMQAMPAAIADAIAQGNDGLIVNDVIDHASPATHYPAQVFIAFRPEQIKSVNNAGNFSGDDARILFSQPKTPSQAAAENAQKRATVSTATGAQQPVTFTYTDRFEGPIRGRLNNLREWAQDKMLSALFVQEDIEAARGAIADAVNVYRRENLMHGRTGDQLETLKRTHVDPLVKAMKAEGLDDAVVEDYLEAKFAPERNKIIAAKNPNMPDGGSGMTDAEAADFLAGKTDGFRSGRKITPADTAKLQRIATKIQALRAETLDRLESSGMINAQAKAAMLAQAPNYVPLRGKDGAEIGSGRGGAGKGIDVRGSSIKEALGRGAGNRAVNILAEMIADAERSIVQAEKNRVGKTLARLVLENPNPDLWEVEPVRLEQKLDSVGQVYQAVQSNAQDQDAIRIMHDGKPYFVRLSDPKLRDAMKNLGVDNSGAVIKFMGGINRYFSAVLTRYNPSFIAVNALRDLGFGMTGIAAEHGVKVAGSAAAKYPAAMRAMWRDNRGTLKNTAMDRYAREFSEAGGKTFFAKRDSVEEISSKVAAEFKSYGKLLRRGQVGLAWNKAVNNSALLKVVNDANDTVENAMRLSAYAALRESGKSVEQAAEYAKNITVNFNRKGQAASGLNAVILFYNAATQGAHRSIRLLKNPKVMAAMGSLAGLQAVLAAYAMGADDEDEDGLTAWEKIPPYEKERNLIIPIVGTDANGKRRIRMVKWPMPYGFNVFSYAGGRLAELAMSKEPKPAKFANDMGNAMVNAFSPIKFIDGMDGIKPHFMKIFDALGQNKDDLGFPIRSENQYSKYEEPRAHNGKADTPEAYKAAAKALNRLGGGDEVTPPKIMRGLLDWAPEDLEFLTEQLTGGIGRFASDSYGVGEKLFAGIDTQPKDYPILRSIVSDVDMRQATAGIYYDRREDIEREKARLRLRFKEEGIQAARDLIKETPELQGFRLKLFKSTGRYTDKSGSIELETVPGTVADAYKRAEKALTDVNQKIKAAQAASYPSLKAKLEAIRELQAERKELQDKFNATFHAKARAKPGR
jgi:GGDEF domain-containing protein